MDANLRGDALQPSPRIEWLAAQLDGYDADRYRFQRYEKLEDAEPTKRRKRRPSLPTLIRQAQRAGLTVAEIRPDGTLVIGKPSETDDRNEWDDDDEATLQ